ncbi:MAG: AMP-binding protein [Firmicutes bacterium]|nr:AMP-binding protein [Bacillota bacterium]
MNKKLEKYKQNLYEFREVRDLKQMLYSSAQMFSEKTGYLVKERIGGPYLPITFQQFREDVDGLGTALLELGLEGKKIAIIGENRYDWLVAHMAALCGVGISVPLDKELPAGEVANLLNRSGASALIYSSKVEKKVLQALEGTSGVEYLISMDAQEDTETSKSMSQLVSRGRYLIAHGDYSFINAPIDPNAMAILLFTSGTTGLAKGVMLSHKNICSNVYAMSKFVNVSAPDEVALSVLPMHHTYEQTCLQMTCLYQGCTVAYCEGLKYITKNMAEAKATVTVAVPLIYESMHKKVWKKAEQGGKADKMRKGISLSKKLSILPPKATKSLFKDVHAALGGTMRTLIAGGAAIDPHVVEDFRAMGFNIFQGYGMTECSPIIAVNMDRYSKPASVGLPVPGTRIKLTDMDENGVGEIICKSDSVMLGYYENEEETAKVLKDGWLHTGDYGRFDEDGFLYICGRKKNVIVTKNGKNIFPEEVEFYLMKSDFIAEVVVRGKDDEKSGETIVWAEIYPDFTNIKEQKGDISQDELKALIKREIDMANDPMSTNKRVKRFKLRDTEFEKTTTKKIKR